MSEHKDVEPIAWEGAEEWEPLAFHLCAEEHGEEHCHDLLWDSGPVPEPWGDRWLTYEDEAKRMIALVRQFSNTQSVIDTMQAEKAALENQRNELLAVLESMMRDTGLVMLMRPDQIERAGAAIAADEGKEG